MNSKRALLVIDMQLVAFDGKITPPIPNGSSLLTNVFDLIGTARNAGFLVIYVQTCALSGQPYAKDVHGWEIHPDITPGADEPVFHKVGPSGFENPKLDPFLKSLGVEKVVVCGIWSEGCVAYTCDSAMELGYDVTLVADAHSTVRGSEADALAVREEQNQSFEQKGVGVISTQEMILDR